MTYEELYKKYKRLLRENRIYRQKYGPINIEELNFKTQSNVSNENKTIDKYSTPEEKVELYMSLFIGRTDVYARRWESHKTEKTGYSPVCLNEWKPNICGKPNTKCSKCEYKNYDNFNELTVKKHLTGMEVVGLYPLLEDDTCMFLAMDFDKEEWEKDVLVIREVCIEKGIPFSMERSRSGNGAHIWYFFSEKISAKKARQFGSSLLTYSMDKRHEIGFSSYDRLFPNQDTMPSGGFGNLIALPLQKVAREDDNSVFIDENFIPYDDQWQYISSITCLSKIEVDKLVNKLTYESEIGEIDNSIQNKKPWTRASESDLKNVDLPASINIIKANMLYVEKNGLSSKAINKIKRLATFKNPEFYKSQAMRLPVYNKPRFITLSDETENYVYIPRGCEEKLIDLLNNFKTEVSITDERNIGKKIDVEFMGKLREEQQEALDALLKYDNGILSASTAFGKTVVGIKLVADLRTNTLILVHTKQLMLQWKERIEEFLQINETLPIQVDKRGRKKKIDIIGEIGGGKKNANGIVDVALMQSLVSKGEAKELVKDYGLVIVDECHRSASYTYEQILKTVTARYVYGLTATPLRQDGHHPIAYMCCGNIRYTVNTLLQTEKRPFEHYIIPRITRCKIVQKASDDDMQIQDVFTYLVDSQIRNNLIVNDILENYHNGRNILVLTERNEHINLIYDMIKNKLSNVYVLSGRVKKKEQINVVNAIKNVPSDQNIVLIATGKYIGEGFDCPRLDTLLLTIPISWRGRLQQYAGRLHRLYDGKKDVMILDYVDIHIPVLEKMYQKRLRGYASLGYRVKSDYNGTEGEGIIFDEVNYLPTLRKDVESALSRIVICSPYVNKRRTM